MLEGAFGGIFAQEVYAYPKEIYWDSFKIRFKVPAEHTIEGVRYDLEMQVLHTDYYDRAFFCSGKTGAFSYFFKNTETANSFFDWTADPKTNAVDLSTLIPKDIAMHNQIGGYYGSDTIPMCTFDFCWYLINKAFDVNSNVINFFTNAVGIQDNTRAVNLGRATGIPVYSAEPLFSDS
mmetsp:Transcript_19947/g.14651  ORF Transcript_19947/g.14651 Transcript_19947/m.14651 type:complete len:178 (-) Transcript_19947:39-572(-)